jgi:hypothetical protein
MLKEKSTDTEQGWVSLIFSIVWCYGFPSTTFICMKKNDEDTVKVKAYCFLKEQIYTMWKNITIIGSTIIKYSLLNGT